MSRPVAAAALLVVAIASVTGVAAAGERRPPERGQHLPAPPIRGPARFTDAQILRGFLAVALGAEFSTAPSDRIRRFDGPVRVLVDGTGIRPALRTRRAAEVAAVVAEIARGVPHLDLATTPDRGTANLTVLVVPRREVAATVRAVFGPARARTILRRLQPECISGFSRDSANRITQAAVVLAADTSDFAFRDCAIEEILQALGPIDDTDAVPWTMFNDAVRTGRFGRYDRHLLGLLYHPRMRPGMTRAEAEATARAILPEVRAAVDGTPSDAPAPVPAATGR